jgi:hypothetical protein
VSVEGSNEHTEGRIGLMTQQRVSSSWRQWTCAGGTCAPPAPKARNAFERALDTYTDLTAPFLRGCVLFPILAAVVYGSFRLGMPDGLWLAAAYFLVFGGYCLANFVRCREAHCVVTGGGWSALGVVGMWSTLTGDEILGALWNAFAVIALLGFAFEAAWTTRRGINTLR